MDLQSASRSWPARFSSQARRAASASIALADLLHGDAPVNPLAPKKPHFAPKAKNVIFLFMEGGPSQMDLFDPKPELQKWHGKPLPASMTKDLKLAFIKPTAAVLGSPREFKQYGQSGMEFSDYLPHMSHGGGRHLHGAVDVHRRVQPSSGPVVAVHRDRCSSGGRRWARGRCTGSGASRRTCRALRC